MDLSKLSDADLQAISSGDMGKVSDEGLQHLSSLDSATEQVIENRPKNGYDGAEDKDLAWYQKAERGAERMGLVKPGEEMFSPNHIDETKKVATAYAPLATGAYSLVNPGTLGAAQVGAQGLMEAAGPMAQRGAALAAKGLLHATGMGAGYGVYKGAKKILFGN